MPPKATPRTDDINGQIEETERILTDIRHEKEAIQPHLQELRDLEIELGRSLDEESQVYVSPSVDRLVGQSQEIAEKEAELAHADSLLKQARALAAIGTRLDELKREQADLEDQLREARKPSRTRLNALREFYSQVLTAVDFPGYLECSIDSQSLMPNINGNLYIHTGTALRGLATVSYHLALLELARRQETFFPQMLVIDSPAVGDLNDENHDKLLHYFAKLQADFDSQSPNGTDPKEDWQIILTTRRMIPELEPYVIEEISAPGRMLLQRSK